MGFKCLFWFCLKIFRMIVSVETDTDTVLPYFLLKKYFVQDFGVMSVSDDVYTKSYP